VSIFREKYQLLPMNRFEMRIRLKFCVKLTCICMTGGERSQEAVGRIVDKYH